MNTEVTDLPAKTMRLFGVEAVNDMGVNSDGTLLAILHTRNNDVFVDVFDIRTLCSSKSYDPFKPLCSTRVGTQQTNQGSCLEWNPAFPDTFAAASTDRSIMVAKINPQNPTSQKLIGIGKLGAITTAISWSPKGKQLTIGDSLGKIVQLKPELDVVRSQFGPERSPAYGKVTGLCWLATTEWMVSFERGTDHDAYLMRCKEDKPTEWIQYHELSYTSSKWPFAAQLLPATQLLVDWKVVIVGNSKTSEISVVGKRDEWQTWVSLEEGIYLPTTANGKDTIPIGVAVDRSMSDEVSLKPDGSQKHRPSPLVLCLTNDGVLTAHHVISTFAPHNSCQIVSQNIAVAPTQLVVKIPEFAHSFEDIHLQEKEAAPLCYALQYSSIDYSNWEGRISYKNEEEVEEVAPAEALEGTLSNRGLKRMCEASELTTPPAKREQHIELIELDCEEQLRVDHPQDDNEAHAPGARVYAIYQKAFYPAVILAERDGLGRYKLQFLADKLVKDVPNSGIIPLRALVPGKTAIYDEENVRLEAIPNDISASEWAKGKVTISTLDDEGEPTDDVKIVEWKDISFYQSEWRDYIKNFDQNATAIVPAGEDDDRVLPMKEEAIGQNIFSGKVFMLTSANRSGPHNVSSMFKKKNLMTFITDNGGIVTEQLNYFQESHADLEPLLISDTYYRTHKYLAALARGIPCVSNLLLQECAEQGECVDYEGFILPAGASIFESDTDMPAPKNPSELLKGKAIYVHSTHTARENTQLGPGGTFIEIWKPILEMLGATVIESDWATLDEIELKFDVALVDGTFREEVMSYADKIGAGKVTSEWVIQTIILGKAPDPTAHSKFDPYRLHHRTRY